MFNFNIVHISDIHIKNNKYINYDTLFDRLKEEKKIDVIVITGDIINSVTNINTNIIIDVISFLISLSNIAPIILIPGNHDINCKYDDNDFFTTILKNHEILKPPRCNYWRNSGKYIFMDIIWTVIAPDENIPEFEFNLKYPQILLFHENLDRINTENFLLYNAVLAGHFHTRQIIAPNAAYSGSLFQQNIGESHNNHGIIIWELIDNNTTIKEINIKNDYSFLKVIIENDVDITEQPLPEKILYYDIYHSNTKDINKFINYYKKIYNKEPRNIKDNNKYNTIMNDSSNIDINELSLHNNLIKQFLGENNELLPEILELHKKNYLSHYVYQDSNNSKLKLLSLEFENLYNYDTNNKIDFTEMDKKISGIIGENNIGKTSLIDIIIYALFDVHPRISSKQFIINKNKTNFNVILEFEINYKYGVIKKKNNKCEFYYDNENLTKKTISQTLIEIKKIVGTFNDNIFTTIQLQYNQNNFINTSNLSRKQKLADLLSLKIFENIETTITKQISNYSNYYKILLGYQLLINEEIDIKKIETIKHQIRCVDNIDYEINDQYNDPNIKLYEDLLINQKQLKELNFNKKIIINKIELTNNDNNNKENIIINYNNITNKISNIINKINNFEPENIKNAVIEKYNTNGIEYLYKLCRSEKKSKTVEYVSNIANLLLEKDHNDKLKEIIEIDLEKIYKNINYNNQLKEIEINISNCINKINEISHQIKNSDELYNNLFEEHKKYIYKNINDSKKEEIDLISKKLKLLKVYKQVIKPSEGIINILLNNIRSKIENGVNNLLTDFKIKIENNFDILYSIDNNYWLDISLSSGYQKFIINIIFRLILWEISDVVILDALFIDEGFGTCDDKNIDKIIDLLKWIIKQNNLPKILFIITHDKKLINILDYLLYIESNKIMNKKSIKINENTYELNNDQISEEIQYKNNEICDNVIDKIDNKKSDEIKNSNNQKFYYCEFCNIIINIKYKVKHLNSNKHNNNFK